MARKGQPPNGIAVKHTRKLVSSDIARHRGLRVTTVSRTLLDLAIVFQVDRLELVLEDALRKRMTTVPRLRHLLATTGRNLPGAKRLRTLIDRRDPAQRPTDTLFEAKLFALLKRAKLPLPEPGIVVSDGNGFSSRPDFAYPKHRFIIEAHSYRWHSGRKAMDHDNQREKKLRRLGWRILYVTYEDLLERSDEVIADIRAALANDQLFS